MFTLLQAFVLLGAAAAPSRPAVEPFEPRQVTLHPFNEIFYNRYNVYWDVLTPALYAERRAARKH